MLKHTKLTTIYVECNDPLWENLMYWFLARNLLDTFTVPGRDMEDLLTYLEKIDTWDVGELEELYNENRFANFTFYHYTEPMWVKTNYSEGWN